MILRLGHGEEEVMAPRLSGLYCPAPDDAVIISQELIEAMCVYVKAFNRKLTPNKTKKSLLEIPEIIGKWVSFISLNWY